jgi:hypothetical protein
MSYKISAEQPIKYDLLVHTALSNYPTLSDFIVDTCSYLIKVHGSKKSELSQSDLKFSAKTLKYIFGTQLEDEAFKAKIKTVVAEGLTNGSLSKDGEFIFVSEQTFTNYFSIV